MGIKIGVLVYYSSIYPDMAGDLMRGFMSALPDTLVNERFFEVVPEYVKQATNRQVLDSVQKLITFDRSDIITGLVNYKAIPELMPVIGRSNKLGFFCDMGEYIPYTYTIKDNLFFNSFQLWQSQYALGYWAHKSWGDKGSVLMSFFDCGFHLHNAFRQGAIAAGSKEIEFSVLFDAPPNIDVVRMTEDYIRSFEGKQLPAYLNAIFCGNEALDFMKVYRQSSWYQKVPLIITAHMASEEILGQIDTDMEVYSASLYNYHSPDEHNIKFRSNYERKTGQKVNVFSLLGYEMALGLLETYPLLRKRDLEGVAAQLRTQTIKSPRGLRNFYHDSDYALPLIDIEKIKVANRQVSKLVIEQGKALKYSHSVYEEIHRENISGWQNPYLCV